MVLELPVHTVFPTALVEVSAAQALEVLADLADLVDLVAHFQDLQHKVQHLHLEVQGFTVNDCKI